jgi:hypothetical protein
MKAILDRLAASLLQPINPSLIIVLGLYTILWGLWVVNPFWTVFSQAPLFHLLAAYGGEYVWGSVAVASGLSIVRGALKPSFRNLVMGSGVGFLHWLVIGIFYFLGDWANTGGITAMAFAVYSLMIYLNIKVNKTYFKGKGGK